MSKTNRLFRLAVVALGTFAMVGCGSNCAETSAAPAADNTVATLVNGFSSQAVMTYSNSRPTYNYYLTTFTFQTLEIYSDNTYCFGISASTFSAVILPEAGQDATANERNNYYVQYFGTFTYKDDDIDVDTRYYTLAKPTRMIQLYDGARFCDTANWTDDMKKNCTDKNIQYNEDGTQEDLGETTYDNGADYLAAHPGFESIEVTATLSVHLIEYVKDGITSIGSAV